MLTRRPPRGQWGSGSAIGVAIMFPMLMMVIVALSILTDTARTEQAVQAAADRAARTASLCCYYTGGTDGADAVARTSLSAAHSENHHNRIYCINDFVTESTILFFDVAENVVTVAANSPVPPGGTVYVYLRCTIPPQALGGFGWPGLQAERTAVGVAAVDPYRFRAGA